MLFGKYEGDDSNCQWQQPYQSIAILTDSAFLLWAFEIEVKPTIKATKMLRVLMVNVLLESLPVGDWLPLRLHADTGSAARGLRHFLVHWNNG